jgi:hypothetical protein
MVNARGSPSPRLDQGSRGRRGGANAVSHGDDKGTAEGIAVAVTQEKPEL